MPDQRSKSLRILTRVLAAISGLIALGVFWYYGVKPSTLNDTSVSFASAILGVLGVIYYFTIHPFISRTRHALSALILSIITLVNLLMVIAGTGGLDSPFYSFWLLVIVVAGIFGTIETVAVVTVTLAYYLYALIAKGFHGPYIRDHLIQLAITLVAAGLAEWVHSRGRRAAASTASLSGQLSAEQLKAEAIIQGIGEGVMVVDSARKIKLFNNAAQELTGWDESSALDIDYTLVFQLKTAEDQPLTDGNEPFTEAWKSGTSIVRDNIAMTTRAGRKVQLSLSISPMFDAQQHPNGAIALFRDISKEKAVERERNEFISTASHEMRTPVAAIEGYLSLAMNPNVATVDERAKKYLDKAHEAIQHLGQLFRDLLSVTKAEEGKLTSKLEAVNIAQLVQAASDDMLSIAQKKNLTLVYQIANQGGKAIAPLFYVAGNSERLREVIMNLIDNAIKFTGQGGVRISVDGDDKEVTVSVSDSGVGITPEDIPHLFQKFYRIDSTDTRTIGGTGLGLYLCRNIIELFNGRIWVESKVGQGSVFKFTLPRLTQDEATRMLEAAAMTNQNGDNETGDEAGEKGSPSTPVAAAPIPALTPPQAQPQGPTGPKFAPVAEPVPGSSDPYVTTPSPDDSASHGFMPPSEANPVIATNSAPAVNNAPKSIHLRVQ